MDNPEEVMQILERFNVARNPEITAQLEEYITFVARTGDSVYAWSLVKNLFREKLVHVITEFYNETPTKGNKNNFVATTTNNFALVSELPQYPNVDPFNYETMKKMLIEKLDSFAAAPFTIQRISELLSDPRKQYSRIDKFMRAVEKTILVVSTVPPGRHRSESENGDSLDSALNGDFASEVNVDIDMEQDVTKEPSVPHKEQNNEAVAAKETTKKTEDEAKTSDKPEEKEVEVPVAVLESTKVETAPENPVVDEADKPATSVIKEPEVLTETHEPKVDDSVSNEPIRSAENEILVDTAEIISETTPLAALENIVAIRTEPVADAVEPEASVTEAAEESSETEVKRQKIEEVPITEPPFVVEEVATVAVEVAVAPLIPELVEKTETESPVEAAETSVIQEQTPIIPPTEPVTEILVPVKIDEPVIAAIPIEEAVPTEDIAETPATDMETVPASTENKMSLDEDEPPAIEQEMTPIASKMDTDDVEAAPMDFEDDAEPMDQ